MYIRQHHSSLKAGCLLHMNKRLSHKLKQHLNGEQSNSESQKVNGEIPGAGRRNGELVFNGQSLSLEK